MKSELVKTAGDTGIEIEKAKSIWSKFEGFFDAINECASRVEGLEITDVSQKGEMKLARETRLELKKNRVAAGKTKKELKESILKEGRFIDRVYGLIADSTKPVEEDLLKKETFAKRKEEERKAALKNEREEILKSLGADSAFYSLDIMGEEQWENLVELGRRNYEAAIARERADKEERLAREKAEAEERAKLAAENERLRQEQEEREREIAEDLRLAREEAREAKEAAERKAAEEMARVEEARRAAEEVARKERERREAIERAEREKQEAEIAKVRAEKEAAEAKIREAEEAERAEQQRIATARARLELASDQEKLTEYIDKLLSIETPSLTSAAAAGILVEINECLLDSREEARGL